MASPWPRLSLPFAPDGAVRVVGPRRQWGGPLDVDGLATAAVVAAAGAAEQLSRRRGRAARCTVDTRDVVAAFDSLRHLRIDGRTPAGFAPLSGFFATADGWVRTHANYPHHRRALLRTLGLDADGDDDADRLRTALAERGAEELEAAVTRTGGVVAAVRTPEQWHAHEHGRAVGAAALVDVTARGGTRGLPRTDDLAMTGLRVLDLTRVIAGPTATRLLGALGADVLRIDPPALPEILDQHLDTGFAKRSAQADLADPDSRAAVEELLARADVMVTGYRPGALAALGLDGPSLLARHPHLVVAELSAWGPGPWQERRGFDSIVQAASGIAHRYGTIDRSGVAGYRPGALPVQALDHAAGYLLAAAVMALLAAREERGGALARVSLARVAHELLALPAPGDPAGGVDVAHTRIRTSAYGTVEYVPPPITIEGRRLDFPTAPARYGAASLAWR